MVDAILTTKSLSMSEPVRKSSFSLDKETLMPLGAVVTVVVAALWLNTQLITVGHMQKETNTRIDMLSAQVASLQAQMAAGSVEVWSRRDMIRWVELANAKSPTANLPLPSK